MREKQTRWNMTLICLAAVTGNVLPVLRELNEAGWNLSDVDPYYYFLLALSLLGFYIAFKIVIHMAIPKQTTSFYLSLLGVNFLINIAMILIFSVTAAVIY